MTEPIYERPHDYDLEHLGDYEDVRFYQELTLRLQPRRVLELGCGSGRVTIALAGIARRQGFDIVGVDLADAMLAEAERKRCRLAPDVRERLVFVKGDMRWWSGDEPFDLILTPCSTMSHLLTIDDQLAAWRQAYDNLVPGGRLVVDVAGPDLRACAAGAAAVRPLIELDSDSTDAATGERLVRFKSSEYVPHEQRTSTRFIYDKFAGARWRERYISDFEAHVYFPRELQLLFRHSGFEIEALQGDYRNGPLQPASTVMIVTGRRPH